MDLFGSPTAGTSKDDQTQCREQQLKDLWSHLLDSNTARVCSRYVENDDCTIKVLLRVVYQQFKEILGKNSNLENEASTGPEENRFKAKKQLFVSEDGEVERLKERNAYLESKLVAVADLLDSYNVLEARKLARDALAPRSPKAGPSNIRSPLNVRTPTRAGCEMVLAAPTPEKTLLYEKNETMLETQRRVIPETVPVDYDLDATIVSPTTEAGRSPLRNFLNHPKSPIIKGKRKASSSDNLSPVARKNSPLKRGKSDEYLTYCSPSLMERDALDYAELPTTPKKGLRVKPNSPKSPVAKKSPFKSPLPVHSPRCLKPTTESIGKKHLKQMTLFETSFQGKVKVNVNAENGGEYKKAEKKPVFLSRPNPHDGKKRRKKTPEDWPCAECRRLFYESGIDTRKLQVSMNFCPEHRNGFSYYLQTPPGFWDPDIPQGPRRAVDCDTGNDDDDDFE